MSLLKTIEDTDYNQKNAIFYRCEVELPENEDGEIESCGNNCYPTYPYDQFFHEFNEQQDPNLKPALFEDLKKKEVERQKQAGI